MLVLVGDATLHDKVDVPWCGSIFALGVAVVNRYESFKAIERLSNEKCPGICENRRMVGWIVNTD